MDGIPHKITGWIEVICGSMFSGKTEELIRRLKRVAIATKSHNTVQVFKPSHDTRGEKTKITSHDLNGFSATTVENANAILNELNEGVKVVAIDEVQFFRAEAIVYVCKQLANDGKRVICAGLDMDYEGKSFEATAQLLATAEFITKLRAICEHCGATALHSLRKNNTKERVAIGAKELYEAVCRQCYNKKENASSK